MRKVHWVDEYANFKLKWKAEAWIMLNHLNIFHKMRKEHDNFFKGTCAY